MTVGFVSSAVRAEPVNQDTTALAIPGASAGNLLIAWAAEQSGASFTADNLLPATPTYTAVNTTAVSVAVWVRTLVAADLGATVTFRASVATHRPVCGMLVLSNAASIDAESTANATGTSVDCPALIPSHDHDAAVTIGVIRSATARTWTGWTGSTPGPTGGNGAGGTGGVEFASFYQLDLGATSGVSTGVLSQLSSPSNNWVGVSLLVTPSGGAANLTLAATLSTQSLLTAALAGAAPGVLPDLMYAKPNATWGVLKPFNATSGGQWH